MWDTTKAINDSTVIDYVPVGMAPSTVEYDFPAINVATGAYACVFRVSQDRSIKVVFSSGVPAGTKFRCTLSYVM